MTPYQTQAIIKALQYLITEGIPVAKTAAKKQKRTELLQLLTNASRIEPDKNELRPGVKGEFGDDAAATEPAAAPQPIRLEIETTIPDEPNLPAVREGAIAGIPRRSKPQPDDAPAHTSETF
jgi:hypothetical protein